MKHFFSYSRRDSEFVKRLAVDLKKSGMNVWLDQLDIPVGAKWDTCIEQALNDAIGIILVLSTSSVQSDNVMDEVNYAITKGKYIIPIKLDDCEVPFRLARIQQINFQGDYDKNVETIVANIHLHVNVRQGNTDTKTDTAIDRKTISDPTRITNIETGNDSKITEAGPKPARIGGNEKATNPKVVKDNVEPPGITWNEETNDTKTASTGPVAPRLTWKDDINDPKSIRTNPDPPGTLRNEETAKAIKPKPDAPAVVKSNKKIIYAVCVAAGVLLLFFWLFATSSGKEFYSSVLASFTDNNYHYKKQSMPELLLIIIVGAIAGWLAGMIVGSDGQSFLLDVIIGIVGGYISSKWIFHGTWRLTGNYYVNLILTATVGAAILAFVIKMIRRVVKR